jgi:nicotinate dehydrogenase subunit B
MNAHSAVGAGLSRDSTNHRDVTPLLQPSSEPALFPEQYELHTAPLHRFEVSRRSFLKTFGGGLAVLWLLDLPEARAQSESGGGGRGGGRGGNRRPPELAAWLHIAADGTVTVFSGKTEVGQNVRTMLVQAVAEELPTPLSTIKIVLADTALVPWDAGTFGSRSTPDMFPQIRRVAATAREALIDLAAKQWNVDRITLTAADGKIKNAASDRTLGFGELTKGEKLVLNVSESVALTPANAWKIAGTSLPKIDGASFVTGQHAYTTDISRPGMLHGRVLRPTSFGATLVSLDTAAADAMPGVTVVRDGDFVGVAAPTEHLAARAVAALRAEWESKKTPLVSERDLFTHLRAHARKPSAGVKVPVPPAVEGVSLQQSYTVDYIAHAPLEPRAAVAEWQGEQLTVWTGSQRPFGVRGELAQALRIPEERVRVIIPDTGSGYGGKHTGEAAVEAARIARAAGKPVKLIWTREEEFTWAYFRPAGVIEITSAASAAGLLTKWEHLNYNSGNAGIRSLYNVPGQHTEFFQSQSPLRQGSYRALAATANHFARETHIDELAHALQLDPVAFRLKNLTDARARAVLEAATAAFGWGKTERAAGHGRGLAIGLDKGGYLATCVDIAIDRQRGTVRVLRVVQAFECGGVINPEHLKNQNEGSIVQGLGGALFEGIRFEDGRILNPRFSTYRVPRFSDTPKIEIVLVDRKDLPSAGAGEAPIVGIAPAIGNAICDATGIRLRALPLVPNGLKV